MPLVLIVEDHDDTRQMYAAFLSSSFEGMEAATGEQALARIAERRPDLIITDLSLPGIDGLDLIAQIRRQPDGERIRVICLSGYGAHTYEERAHAVGCNRVLQKPMTPDALEQIAHELLRDSAGGSQET